MGDQRDHEKQQKHHEEYFRNPGGRNGHASESKHAGKQGDYKNTKAQ